MRRGALVAAMSLVVGGCGSDGAGVSPASSIVTTSAPIETSAPTPPTPLVTSTTEPSTTEPSTSPPDSPTTAPAASGRGIETAAAATEALAAAGLRCELEPVPADPDPAPFGPDVEMADHTCVLGYHSLTLSFFESPELRASGIAEILEFFGPVLKNFGYTEVAYAWADDGVWAATLEPATSGFDLDAEVPRSEREALELVAEALGGDVQVIEL